MLIAEIENKNSEALKLKQEYELALENAEKKAASIIKEAKQRALEEHDKQIKATKDETLKLIEDANNSIDLEKKKSMQNIQSEISDIAMLVASKIIQKNMNDSVNNKIIEEFMLACNETVAENYYWLNMPFVYRIHEDPEEEKMYEFSKFVNNLGYTLKGNQDVHPRELQKLLEKVKGKKEETLVNTMSLGPLEKQYITRIIRPFGLAATYYCHFTSPIRRYPDLQIHRIIKGQLNGKYQKVK